MSSIPSTKELIAMPEIIRCTRCILPSTLPGIKFNEQGVCNYCRDYDRSFREWEAVKVKKEKQFQDLLTAARKMHRAYDCLVPLSGGKDSTYVLYLCAKVYRMHCLAVTFDNGFMTQLAKDNIQRAIEATQSDHLQYRINSTDMNALFKTFLVKTGNFCTSCMRAINFTIEKAAQIYRVPIIIKGSGKRVQYVSQIELPKKSGSNSSFYFERVLKREKIENKFRIFHNRWWLRMELFKSALILSISPRFLVRFFPQALNLYDYIYHPYPEVLKIIEREMGWKKQDLSFEHTDCSLHNIPFYIDSRMVRGITIETFHNSALVRQGILSRESALEVEVKLLKQTEPPLELIEFLNKNGMTLADFQKSYENADPKRFVPYFEKMLRSIYKSIYYKKR